MPKEQSPGKPTTRRYPEQEKAAAVRMVRTLRAELGTEHGTVRRVSPTGWAARRGPVPGDRVRAFSAQPSSEPSGHLWMHWALQ
jgi:hypothetical protein